MRVVWLAWYICGVCLLLALLASAITYHPDIQHLGVVLPAAFGGVALLAGGAAVGVAASRRKWRHTRGPKAGELRRFQRIRPKASCLCLWCRLTPIQFLPTMFRLVPMRWNCSRSP